MISKKLSNSLVLAIVLAKWSSSLVPKKKKKIELFLDGIVF